MIIPAALECHDLSAGYDKLVVVRQLDLAVRHKEILAVLGPNGAGKTTLLMTLAGFLAPAGGTIMMDGAEIRCGSPRRANRAGIVLVPDHRALFTELTPVQNLQRHQLLVRRAGQGDVRDAGLGDRGHLGRALAGERQHDGDDLVLDQLVRARLAAGRGFLILADHQVDLAAVQSPPCRRWRRRRPSGCPAGPVPRCRCRPRRRRRR
jgi:ABC-type uncharacterized transport system YnjBCD ATPase subunit